MRELLLAIAWLMIGNGLTIFMLAGLAEVDRGQHGRLDAHPLHSWKPGRHTRRPAHARSVPPVSVDG